MTREERVVVELGDVTGLVVDCTRCGASATLPLKDDMKSPGVCPQCGSAWWGQHIKGPDVVGNLATAISLVRRQNDNEQLGYRIRLALPPA